MATKKVRVKVKKRRLKVKNILIFLLVLLILYTGIIHILGLPIKNIYVSGNSILSDNEIINIAKIEDYPPFLDTITNNISKLLKKNDYIKNVKIKRTLSRKIYITITEYRPLFIIKDQNKVILENGKKIDNDHNISNVPILLNNVTDDIYDRFIQKFSKVDNQILLKISEIEYVPLEVDSERFALYMNDDILVYITLSKIDNLNKYIEIHSQLDGKKGILYLDSGNYFEER